MTREEIILAHIRRDGSGRAGELPAGTRLGLLQQVDREQSLS